MILLFHTQNNATSAPKSVKHVDVKTQKESSEHFQSSENFEPPQVQRAPNFVLPQPMEYTALPSIQLSQHLVLPVVSEGNSHNLLKCNRSSVQVYLFLLTVYSIGFFCSTLKYLKGSWLCIHTPSYLQPKIKDGENPFYGKKNSKFLNKRNSWINSLCFQKYFIHHFFKYWGEMPTSTHLCEIHTELLDKS